MIRLFHGTSTKSLNSILRDGLLPRGAGRKGNFSGHLKSKRGFVYLSTWMPMKYSGIAAGHKDDFAILEVDASELVLYPDEDFVIEAKKSLGQKVGPTARAAISPRHFARWAGASLKFLGSCCVERVPKRHIIGSVVVPWSLENWAMLGGDVSNWSTAYRLLGGRYEERIAALFDEGLEAALALDAVGEPGIWTEAKGAVAVKEEPPETEPEYDGDTGEVYEQAAE